MFKALGDNTRYGIYLELARAPSPRSTVEVAELLDLHPNTVRPHLERMRELGLLEVRARTSGGVGRPQHLYSLASDAPSLGLEPPVYPAIAGMLLALASEAGLSGEDAAEVGRDHGRTLAGSHPGDALQATLSLMVEWGFDPEPVDAEQSWVWFGHCPFSELAEANPELVCSLHRGLIEGLLDARGDEPPVDFHDRTARQPCCVVLDTERHPEPATA